MSEEKLERVVVEYEYILAYKSDEERSMAIDALEGGSSMGVDVSGVMVNYSASFCDKGRYVKSNGLISDDD